MEIATALNNAIEQLNKKKTEIEEKIKNETLEIDSLTKNMSEIEERIETLTNSLANSKQELVQLNNTIVETEDGYQKIVQAGETLMSIVSQNLPKYLNTHD
jgi:chromosome segregation ATPase